MLLFTVGIYAQSLIFSTCAEPRDGTGSGVFIEGTQHTELRIFDVHFFSVVVRFERRLIRFNDAVPYLAAKRGAPSRGIEPRSTTLSSGVKFGGLRAELF